MPTSTAAASTLSRAHLDKLPNAAVNSSSEKSHARTRSACSASTAAASTLMQHHKKVISSVEESWKEKETLKKAIALAQANRKKFLAVLIAIDTQHTNECSFTLFMQSSIDTCLNFDESTIEYITKHRCDPQGNVNYRRLAADMVIKTYIDFTGCIKL